MRLVYALPFCVLFTSPLSAGEVKACRGSWTLHRYVEAK